MNERKNRLKAIRNIIAASRISSQEKLLHKLEEEGVNVTQATLSRDLKVLKVGKVPDNEGGYYYVLSETERESLQGYVEDFKRGYLSLAFSGNLAVLKTLTGHADTVAIALDRMELPEIIGTIAGDDTILIIMKEKETHQALISRLQGLMGPLESL